MQVGDSRPAIEAPAGLTVSWEATGPRTGKGPQRKQDGWKMHARNTQECAAREIFLEEFSGISNIPSKEGKFVFPP